MAKNIKVKISLPTQSELQKQLETLIEKAKNINIPLDLDKNKMIKSIDDMSKEIDKLKSQLSSIQNVNIKNSGLDKVKNDLGNIEKELVKIGKYTILEKGNTIANDKVVNAYVKIKDELGSIIKLTEQNGIVTKTMVEPIEKLSQAEKKYEEQIYKSNDALEVKKMKLQEALDKLYARGNVSENQLNTTGLDGLISGLNLGSSASEFERINQLLKEQLSAEREIVSAKKQAQKETSSSLKEQMDLADKVEKVKNKYNAQLDVIEKINEAFLNSSKGAGLKSELEGLRNEINNIRPDNINELNNQTSKLDATIKVTQADVKTMGKEWSLATKNTNSFTGALGEALKKVGLFSISYMVINKIKTSIQDGINTIIELDTAMRDLKRVSEETDSTYSNFLKTANKTAVELGSTTSGVIEATTRFVQLGYSFDEASEKLSKYALILSNVADMSAKDASNAIVSVLKGFQLETEDVGRIVDTINEAGNKFALDSNSLAEGLRIGSANLSIAGNDLEQASAMIIAGTEVMQDSSTVANGLKSISMRLRGITSDGEELNAKLGDLVKNLTGVNLTDANGEFRSTYDVLVDISKVFDTLNSKEQALLLEEVAGKNRANVLASILNNASQLEKAYDTLAQSAGSSAKEQEAYMDSLEGKINAFKESFTGIAINAINSESMKNLIDSATAVVNVLGNIQEKFGTLSLTTGLLSTSFLAFTNNPLKALANGMVKNEEYTTDFQRVMQETLATMKNTTGITNKASVGFKGLGSAFNTAGVQAMITTAKVVALQVALSVGVGLAISAVVAGITALGNSLNKTRNTMDDCTTESKALATALSDIGGENDLIKQYEELNTKLKENQNNADKVKEINEQIAQVKSQLGADEDYYWILNDENKTLEEQLELMKQVQQQKVTQTAIDLDKEMMSQNEANRMVSGLENNINTLKQLREVYENPISGKYFLNGIEISSKSLQESIANAEEKIKGTSLEIERYNGNLKLMDQANYSTQRSTLELSSENKNLIDDINKSTQAVKDNSQAKEENSNVDSGLEDLATKAQEAETAIKNLNDTLSGLKNTNEIIQQAIDEFNQYGELTKDTYDKILSNGTPEMVVALQDSNTFLETYNRLLQEGLASEEAQRQAIIENASEILNIGNTTADVVNQNAKNYAIDEQNQANATNSKIENSILYTNQSSKAVADMTTNNGKNYEIDEGNLRGSIRDKLSATDSFANGAMNGVATFVTSAGQNYVTDANNFVNQTNVKIRAMEMLQATLDSFASNKIEFGGGRGILNPPKSITINKTGGMSPGNYAYGSGGYVGGSANAVNSGVGHGANSSTGGSGSTASSNSATQKEVANMEKIEKRYYYLTKAVEKYSNELDKNKLLQETANDKDKIKLMQEEIALYEKQRQAVIALNNEQKKEAEELKKTLYGGGFRFDTNGDIKDIGGEFARKVAKANSISNPEEKEKYIEFVKKMEDATERYTELIKDLIPKQEQEWLSLGNTISSVKDEIKAVYKEQIDDISSKEKEIADVVEYYAQKQYEAKKEKVEKELELERKRIEGIKESLSKEKELYNKNIEEDDYNANLAKERNKLAEIQSEIDRLSLDNSAKGKQLLAQALKEYETQQQVISDMVKKNQQDATNDRFDSEMEMIDKELETSEEKFNNLLEELDKNLEEFLKPENINKLIQEGLTSGMITVGDTVMNLENAFASMLTQTEYGIISVTNQTSEWINGLKEVQSLYGSINSIMQNAGVNVNLPSGNTRNVSITTGDLIINGSVNEGMIPEIQDMLKQQADEIYKNIYNKLNYN